MRWRTALVLELSHAQKSFASTLIEFKLEGVGGTQTDDERIIGEHDCAGSCLPHQRPISANSLKEFGLLIRQIEEQRAKIVEEAEKLCLDPLQNLAERISRVTRDEKHKYQKESGKF